ncbi:hypothetical protein KHC28_15235 [Ancylobacter sonchi]|uniref:hypothetical protein n=1 Tax=Ancylobacter sonchi TaxID=1937790 RepID=UPI001BD60FEE|nr:hypothetical protein [Ancylobacter sonchi]MBS7535007.1 hypothetical protein [Ancylobacter sonchi]
MHTHLGERPNYVRDFTMVEASGLKKRTEATMAALQALLDELSGDPDPIFTAIAEWRAASTYCWSLIDAPHEALEAAGDAECAAAFQLLTTSPTSLAGFLAFCEWGEEVQIAEREREGNLAEWFPGYRMAGTTDDAETLFFRTLAGAARRFLPAQV